MTALTPARFSVSRTIPTAGSRRLQRPAHRGPSIRTGLPGSPSVALHHSRTAYIEHVEKHFANEAALEALRFAVPRLAACSEFASPRALIRALRCDADHASSQAVLSAYSEAAERTIHDALAQGWVVEPSPRVAIAFAPTGLLAVVEDGVLRTLFFPGVPETDGAASARERSWTAEERHFYRVFRPAMQVIRSLPDDAVAGRVSQYGALKRVMPRASALRLEIWLSLRAAISYDHTGEDHANA